MLQSRKWPRGDSHLAVMVGVQSVPQTHELSFHHGRGFVVGAGATPQERV